MIVIKIYRKPYNSYEIQYIVIIKELANSLIKGSIWLTLLKSFKLKQSKIRTEQMFELYWRERLRGLPTSTADTR